MKLFQKLIKVLKKFKLKQAKSLLDGKEINLTDDNTIITSNNFSVDKDGNMVCNGATFTVGQITSQNFNVDSNGNMTCKNAVLDDMSLSSEHLAIASNGVITMTMSNSFNVIIVNNYDGTVSTKIKPTGLLMSNSNNGYSLNLSSNNLAINNRNNLFK